MLMTKSWEFAAWLASEPTLSELAESSRPANTAALPPPSWALASREAAEIAPPPPPLLVAVAWLCRTASMVAAALARSSVAPARTDAVTWARAVISARIVAPGLEKRKPMDRGLEPTVAVLVPLAVTEKPVPPVADPPNAAMTLPSMRAVGTLEPTAMNPPEPASLVASARLVPVAVIAVVPEIVIAAVEAAVAATLASGVMWA